MASTTLRSADGATAGTTELDDSLFSIRPNVAVMHQVVVAQLAAKRAGTQSTKTRAEVSGGGAKPFRQKGTGRSRQGSIRAPQWRGGGVALGPKPRKYDQRTPKKMKRLALASALSDRFADEKVIVVDEWSFATPSTKAAAAALEALGADGRVLVVVDDLGGNTAKSFRNLDRVQVIKVGELNTYDVLVNDVIVFSEATVPGSQASSPEVAESDSAESDDTESDDTDSDDTDSVGTDASNKEDEQ